MFFLCGYVGRDVFQLADILHFTWWNATRTMLWHHLFHYRLFAPTSFLYSNYQYDFTLGIGAINFDLKSAIMKLTQLISQIKIPPTTTPQHILYH